MIGSTGERVLSIALPHVDAWNIWYDWYGGTPEGLAVQNRTIDALAEEAGRDPHDIARSACVLVVVDRGSAERPIEVPPLEGSPERVAQGLRDLAEAGADEAILVPNPNTEASIRTLGEALTALEGTVPPTRT
jgi:alkanesulfonate monooxygenase SsuD/methylene tetrahydromethanopterin reductase-like flavin-dependent oxidoreductase (luciferase family)